jgi:hypothetical protein
MSPGEQDSLIRLPPGSAGRSKQAYIKLLSRVDPDAQNGFGYEGLFLHIGSWVSSAPLRPTSAYPEIPVLLEHGLMPARGIIGHRRSDSLYVLWRWETAAREWRELGRAVAESWEWAIELRPLAIRALAQEKAAECAPDLPALASEINTFLDSRLKILKPPDRARLLGILHDQFASRLSA